MIPRSENLPFEIFLHQSADNSRHPLKARHSDSILNVKTQVERLFGIPVDHQRLLYSGKQLANDRTLSDYNIGRSSTVSLTLSTGDPRSNGILNLECETVDLDESSNERRRAAWAVKAAMGGYDTDLHIVDPYTHYNWLENLQKKIVCDSEYYRSKGVLNPADDRPRSTLAKDEEYQGDGVLAHDLLTRYSNIMEPSGNSQLLGNLYVSYQIILATQRNAETLAKADFCKNSFNILVQDVDNHLAEIVEIPIALLEGLKDGIEQALLRIETGTDDFEEHPSVPLGESVESPCFSLLERLRFPRKTDSPRTVASMLMLCRMTVLLLDLGLVSYAGSHAIRFDRDYDFPSAQDEIIVRSPVDNTFDFQLSSKRLACLNGFLDEKTVWVFTGLQNGATPPPFPASLAKKGLYILGRMEDIADIWGPVYAASYQPGDDKITHYNVSKGIIRPLNDRQQVRGAILCHWEPWGMLRRLTSRILGQQKDIYLKPKELLLIGATSWRENISCIYTLADFERDYGREMGVLGTRPESWQLDSKALSGSINLKFFQAQLQGTKKLVPQTPIKESIRAKWCNYPERANPAMLNQFLGVEISHCTGNATRIPLRKLITSKSMEPLLFSQRPDLFSTQWGRAFLRALKADSNKMIFSVWEAFSGHRRDMADLIMRILDVVDGTGFWHNKFVAAFIANKQEKSVEISLERNNWARLLQDTHMTAVYAFINENCIEIHTPGNTTATCGCVNGSIKQFTAFRTKVSVSKSQFESIRLKPSGHILDHDPRPNAEADMRVISDPILVISNIIHRNVGIEVRDQLAIAVDRYSISIRASKESYGGLQRARAHKFLQTGPLRYAPLARPMHYAIDMDEEPRSPGVHVQANPQQVVAMNERPYNVAPVVPPMWREYEPPLQVTQQRIRDDEPIPQWGEPRREPADNIDTPGRVITNLPEWNTDNRAVQNPTQARPDRSARTTEHDFLPTKYNWGANQDLMAPCSNSRAPAPTPLPMPVPPQDQYHHNAQAQQYTRPHPGSLNERPLFFGNPSLVPAMEQVPEAPLDTRDRTPLAPYPPSLVSNRNTNRIIPSNATSNLSNGTRTVQIRRTQAFAAENNFRKADSILDDPANYDFFWFDDGK